MAKSKAKAVTVESPPIVASDAFLRGHKFRIKSRPAKGEAIWSRGGREYTQSEATRIAIYEMEILKTMSTTVLP